MKDYVKLSILGILLFIIELVTMPYGAISFALLFGSLIIMVFASAEKTAEKGDW
jgi:hypothetical protein